MKLPSLRTTMAAAVSTLAILAAGATGAFSQSNDLALDAETNFSTFEVSGMYNPELVGPAAVITDRVATQYGTPVEAERYTLSSDGAALVIYYDPADAEITYTNARNDQVLSIDDQLEGRLAVVTLYDGNGHGMIIGYGVTEDNGQTLDGVEDFSYIATSFQQSMPGAQYVVPAEAISVDARSNAGIEQTGEIVIGEDADFSIARLSGPNGDFLEVTAPVPQGEFKVPTSHLIGRVDPVEVPPELVVSSVEQQPAVLPGGQQAITLASVNGDANGARLLELDLTRNN